MRYKIRKKVHTPLRDLGFPRKKGRKLSETLFRAPPWASNLRLEITQKSFKKKGQFPTVVRQNRVDRAEKK